MLAVVVNPQRIDNRTSSRNHGCVFVLFQDGDDVVLDDDVLGRSVKHVDVRCNVCPYGAVCRGPIVSKPNYWGAASE